MRVTVAIGARTHPVLVESGSLARLGETVRGAGPAAGFGSAALVADRGLPADVRGRAAAGLRAAGLAVTEVHLRGERAKRLASVERICSALLAAGVGRDGVVVALGGGVVGDVAGFVAAVYRRGVALVHCPTTLQAMVDSAIGGKNGVNLVGGKNQVGAVHQPLAVVCDPLVLRSCPRRDHRAALAEIVKYGMVSDPAILGLLRELGAGAGADDPAQLEPLIARCVATKAEVVAGDEHDHGRRAILNYGHTVGHALETALGHGCLRHGEAVAVGMRVAGRLSVELHGCPPEAVEEQDRWLRTFGLGGLPAGISVAPAAVLAAAARDKKVAGGTLRWVLLDGMGRASWGHAVPEERAAGALAAVLSR